MEVINEDDQMSNAKTSKLSDSGSFFRQILNILKKEQF